MAATNGDDREMSQNTARRWLLFARTLVSGIGDGDRIHRGDLLDAFWIEYEGHVAVADLNADFTTHKRHNRAGVAQHRAGLRSLPSRLGQKRPSDLLARTLVSFEKAEVVRRDDEWVHVCDWVKLASIADGDFSPLWPRP